MELLDLYPEFIDELVIFLNPCDTVGLRLLERRFANNPLLMEFSKLKYHFHDGIKLSKANRRESWITYLVQNKRDCERLSYDTITKILRNDDIPLNRGFVKALLERRSTSEIIRVLDTIVKPFTRATILIYVLKLEMNDGVVEETLTLESEKWYSNYDYVCGLAMAYGGQLPNSVEFLNTKGLALLREMEQGLVNKLGPEVTFRFLAYGLMRQCLELEDYTGNVRGIQTIRTHKQGRRLNVFEQFTILMDRIGVMENLQCQMDKRYLIMCYEAWFGRLEPRKLSIFSRNLDRQSKESVEFFFDHKHLFESSDIQQWLKEIMNRTQLTIACGCWDVSKVILRAMPYLIE